MKRLSAAACAFALSACAAGAARVDVISRAASFRAKTVGLAGPTGAGAGARALTRALAARLGAAGLRAVPLSGTDSVLAGAPLGLDSARDPRVLSEARRATGAGVIVFLSVDPGWRGLEITAVDTAGGGVVLRADARPRGVAFRTPASAAAAASRALSGLAPRPPRAPERLPDIPVP